MRFRPKSKANSGCQSAPILDTHVRAPNTSPVTQDEEGKKAQSDPPENIMLEVISNALSSADANSVKDDNPQHLYENPPSYSIFHDSGEPIEHPTSYFLQTDSSDDSNTDESSAGQKTEIASTNEEDNEQPTHVTAASSSYSSEGTVKVSNSDNYLSSQMPHRGLTNSLLLKSAPQLDITPLDNCEILPSRPLTSSSIYPHNEDDPVILDSKPHNVISRDLTKPEKTNSQRFVQVKPGRAVLLPLNHFVPHPEPDSVDVLLGSTPKSDVRAWDSAIAALMYSSSDFNDSKPNDGALITGEKQQGHLLRENSLQADKEFLDAVKNSLSRNRSMISNKYSTHSDIGSPPPLFSQGRGKTFAQLPVTMHPNNDRRCHSEEIITIVAVNETENSNNSTSLVDENSEYNAKSNLTELNCLKPGEAGPELSCLSPNEADQKFAKSVTKGLPSIFQSHAQESQVFKNPENIYGKPPPHSGKRSTEGTAKLKKLAGEKRYSILIWVLLMVIMCLICIFVPLLIIYSRGSDSVVIKYLNNISSSHKEALLAKLGYSSQSIVFGDY